MVVKRWKGFHLGELGFSHGISFREVISVFKAVEYDAFFRQALKKWVSGPEGCVPPRPFPLHRASPEGRIQPLPPPHTGPSCPCFECSLFRCALLTGEKCFFLTADYVPMEVGLGWREKLRGSEEQG